MQELLIKSRRSEELVCFYSRCRFIGRLKGLTTLPSENSSPQSHCHSEETAEAPPVADEARWFRGSVPVFTPQRGWKPADTTVCAFAHFSSCWEKWAVGGTVPTKEKHPSERKRKAAKRERIPTTSLRTGLGMTGLAYERIFSGPIKSTLPCTVSLRGNRRSAACGGYSEAVSRKCPGFHAVQAAGNRLTRR